MPRVDREALPRFWGRPLDVVCHVIDWVHAAVVKRAWDDDRIRSRYLQRTVPEILADGDTLVLGPCPDRTFVAASILRAHDIPFQVVFHERHVAAYGPPTAHIAIEITDGARPYWFDFGYRESRFLTGTYFYKPELEETIQIVRFPSGNIDLFALRVEDVFRLVSPRRINMDLKLDWYCDQMRGFNPELLEDHVIYDQAYSVYNVPRPRH